MLIVPKLVHMISLLYPENIRAYQVGSNVEFDEIKHPIRDNHNLGISSPPISVAIRETFRPLVLLSF